MQKSLLKRMAALLVAATLICGLSCVCVNAEDSKITVSMQTKTMDISEIPADRKVKLEITLSNNVYNIWECHYLFQKNSMLKLDEDYLVYATRMFPTFYIEKFNDNNLVYLNGGAQKGYEKQNGLMCSVSFKLPENITPGFYPVEWISGHGERNAFFDCSDESGNDVIISDIDFLSGGILITGETAATSSPPAETSAPPVKTISTAPAPINTAAKTTVTTKASTAQTTSTAIQTVAETASAQSGTNAEQPTEMAAATAQNDAVSNQSTTTSLTTEESKTSSETTTDTEKQEESKSQSLIITLVIVLSAAAILTIVLILKKKNKIKGE